MQEIQDAQAAVEQVFGDYNSASKPVTRKWSHGGYHVSVVAPEDRKINKALAAEAKRIKTVKGKVIGTYFDSSESPEGVIVWRGENLPADDDPRTLRDGEVATYAINVFSRVDCSKYETDEKVYIRDFDDLDNKKKIRLLKQ